MWPSRPGTTSSIASSVRKNVSPSAGPLDTLFNRYFGVSDSVVSTLDEGSMAKAADIVAQCYFYDNREYMCGFPFPADFRQSPSFNLRAATGTFYRASY